MINEGREQDFHFATKKENNKISKIKMIYVDYLISH